MKTFTPISAAAAVCALWGGASGLYAQSSVFEYGFPASYNGTGTTITDLSGAGNNGSIYGTLALAAAPSGSSGNSISTSAGGIVTGSSQLLNNTTVAGAGGFTYDVSFMWGGTGTTQKLIDYAGTESLQLVGSTLQMVYADDAGTETTANSLTISAGVWYNVTLTFDTSGNSLVGSDISGVSSMYVDGNLISSVEATKGDYGDSLDRPIGIGQLGADFGYLVGFKGDIYDPSVTLGVVAPTPEPTSTALLGMVGGLGTLYLRRRKA
jgi:hypothetical protein